MDGAHKYGAVVGGNEVLDVRLEDVFAQVAAVDGSVGYFKVGEEPPHDVQAGACGVGAEGALLGLLPLFFRHRRFVVAAELPQEIAHFGEVAEMEFAHGLCNGGMYSALLQFVGHQHCFFVGAGQHGRASLHFDFRIKQVFQGLHLSFLARCRLDEGLLHPARNVLHKAVGATYDRLCRAVVVGHFVQPGAVLAGEHLHVAGIGAAEGEDVLVVVAHRYDPHFLVLPHQCLHQPEIIGAHVLCLVNDKHALGNLRRLHLAALYHSGSLAHHVFHLVEPAQFAQEVEAVGVEGLDFHIVGGGAHKVEEAFLELGGGGPREGEHQQLLVLHVFQEQQRGQFVYQHPRFAASRPCRHDDVFRPVVVDNLALSVGEAAKELLIPGRCDVAAYLLAPLLLEMLVDELAEVEGEIVVDELQGGVVVADHQVGIFAHDMNLADALLVEFVQQPVLLLAISRAAVGRPAYLHGVVDDDEAAFYLHQLGLGEIEQRFLYVGNGGLAGRRAFAVGEQLLLPAGNELAEHFHDGEIYKRKVFAGVAPGIQGVNNEVANVHAPLEAGRRDLCGTLQADAHTAGESVFLFVNITFQGQEVEQHSQALDV